MEQTPVWNVNASTAFSSIMYDSGKAAPFLFNCRYYARFN